MNIPVVFAANNTYIKQLSTIINSILDHSDSANKYEFHVLTNDIDDDNQIRLNSYTQSNMIFINQLKWKKLFLFLL